MLHVEGLGTFPAYYCIYVQLRNPYLTPAHNTNKKKKQSSSKRTQTVRFNYSASITAAPCGLYTCSKIMDFLLQLQTSSMSPTLVYLFGRRFLFFPVFVVGWCQIWIPKLKHIYRKGTYHLSHVTFDFIG